MASAAIPNTAFAKYKAIRTPAVRIRTNGARDAMDNTEASMETQQSKAFAIESR
jgi:hypothetical protein